MKTVKRIGLFGVSLALLTLAIGCAGGPKVTVSEMENKESSMGVPTPDWIKNYTSNRISSVQALPLYKDKYCIIGEETGVNKQFVLKSQGAAENSS